MDQQLKDFLGYTDEGGKKKLKADITFFDYSGKIEVKGPDGMKEYTLKALKELYAAGTDAPTVDPEDDKYMPLFLGIEGTVATYYEDEHPELTDGTVALTLDQLAMDPDSTPAEDELAQSLAVELRLCLSLWDYSRQEVRAALRKIRKSVERHSKIDGRRGYLDFIVEFFGRRGGY